MATKNFKAIELLLRRIYKIIYWALPPILLYFILSRIDFDLFLKNLAGVNIWLLILGMSFYPVLIFIAGFRWQITLSEYFHLRPSLGYLVRHYWIGIALGFFSPGQLGLDAYRVVIIGKRYRHYLQLIFALFVEKAMAFLNAVLLVLCLYPFIDQFIIHGSLVLDKIINISYLVAIVFLATGGLIVFAVRQKLLLKLVDKISGIMVRFIHGLKRQLETETAEKDSRSTSMIIGLLSRPKLLVYVFLASLAIQFVSAVGNQIIFRAVGYDIPFLVNFFVSPIFYFIFLLPISFGSLGVREGAYIILYGAFGVSPELALLVSFINLSGNLFNNAIGALMIWGGYRKS